MGLLNEKRVNERFFGNGTRSLSKGCLCSIFSSLIVCPMNLNCLLLIVFISSLDVSIAWSTSSLVFLSVQETFNILLHIHISVAFIFFSNCLLMFHDSHPYNNMDYILYMIFANLILVFIDLFVFVSKLRILLNLFFAIAILLFISLSHFPSHDM